MNDDPDTTLSSNSLTSALNMTGLPNTIKGRLQKAIFRFIAGSVAHPYVQQVRDNLDIMDGRSRINAIVAEEIGRRQIADPDFMERATSRLLGDIVRKQENVEAIAIEALKHFDDVADDPVVESESNEAQSEPTQDWFNAFTREAEQASSDELRGRLASVLAGEARKPGTFSRATVRKIAELEQEAILAFQKAVSLRLRDAIFRDPSEWNSGEWFDIGALLETEGLISGSSGFLHRKIILREDGIGFVFGETMALTCIGEPAIEKQISSWTLTRTGMEIANLMPEVDERKNLKRACDFIDKSSLKQIWLGPMQQQGGERVRVGRETLLWGEANVFNVGRPVI